MASRAFLEDFLAEYDSILWISEVCEIMESTDLEVRELAKLGAFAIFVPEADPDEECILKSDIIDYLVKN